MGGSRDCAAEPNRKYPAFSGCQAERLRDERDGRCTDEGVVRRQRDGVL